MIELSLEAIIAIKAHARFDFPKESCGLIVDGAYVRCTNYASEPLTNFVIHPEQIAKAGKGLQAIVHSHPGGPAFPSQNDMEGQIQTNVPWLIIPVFDEGRFGSFVCWGDTVAMKPLVGRPFVHGVSDCYSAVRDLFRLGKAEAAKQGFDQWPFDPVILPEVAREDGWWGKPGEKGDDLYTKGFANGFKIISSHEARPGDGFLSKIRSDNLNHAGLLISSDLIFHHLPGRVSRREPAGLWARAADTWVRYVGPQNAS